MADSNLTAESIRCIVVTPEQTVVDATVDFVVLPLFDGEIGIGLGHSPVIGRLGYGEMRLKQDGESKRFYVDGGFVQAAEDVVSVLTDRAVPADTIDAEAAQQQLDAAVSKLASGPEEIAIRDRLISQARGQLRVAQKN